MSIDYAKYSGWTISPFVIGTCDNPNYRGKVIAKGRDGIPIAIFDGEFAKQFAFLFHDAPILLERCKELEATLERYKGKVSVLTKALGARNKELFQAGEREKELEELLRRALPWIEGEGIGSPQILNLDIKVALEEGK